MESLGKTGLLLIYLCMEYVPCPGSLIQWF